MRLDRDHRRRPAMQWAASAVRREQCVCTNTRLGAISARPGEPRASEATVTGLTSIDRRYISPDRSQEASQVQPGFAVGERAWQVLGVHAPCQAVSGLLRDPVRCGVVRDAIWGRRGRRVPTTASGTEQAQLEVEGDLSPTSYPPSAFKQDMFAARTTPPDHCTDACRCRWMLYFRCFLSMLSSVCGSTGCPLLHIALEVRSAQSSLP